MSFLYPATLFFGVLAAGIVALYLQRPKRRTVQVSSLLFWQRILEREPQRQFLGRLRHPLSLLLQLMIFLLLLLALARPEGRPQGRQSTVIVVDARARMQAGGAFPAALKAASEIASQAGMGHEVAVLAVEGMAMVVSPFTTDARELREKLSRLEVSDAGRGMDEALKLAGDLLSGRTGNKRLIVVTDRPVTGTGGGIEQMLVGRAMENMAILAVAQRPVPSSPQSAEALVRLGNFSNEERKVELELSLDGRPFDVQSTVLKSGEEASVSTLISEDMLRNGDGLFRARLTEGDDLAVDNEARASISTTGRLKVLLISAGNPFLESALRASGNIAMDILSPESWKSGLGGGFDAVIFDNWLPEGATLESLGEGRFLFFGLSPFQLGREPEKAFELERSDSQSALLWNVDVASVHLDRAYKLQTPDGERWRADVVLESGGLPVLMSLESSEHQRAVVAAFAVEDSDFPLRVGFPLFVSNAVHWLAGGDGARMEGLSAGQTYVPEEGTSVARTPLQTRGMQTDKAPSLTGEPIRLRKNGFYELRSTEKDPARWLAVNTANREESDLREAQSHGLALKWSLGWGGLHPWQWLAFAALVLILAEWFLHHRRVTE